MKSYDFIAIGDITTDAFIRLKDASVHCDIDKDNCEICMRFGDKIPYEFVEIVRAVGNASNASVAAARLGLNSALVAQIGNDDNGRECLEVLKNEKVGTDYVKVHEGKKTNYHYVLWYEDDRTILVKHESFDYKLPQFSAPKWIYLSSLGPSADGFHDEIAMYLKANPEVKLAFQPGTYQIKLGIEKLKEIYELSEVFFCNIEEAKIILGIPNHTDPKILLQKMRELGPKIIVLTDGTKGAYVYNGEKILFMPPYPDSKQPYDRTGAGDGFASTFVSALALGLSIEEALCWAPINSMSVVQEIGAQRGLLTKEQIEKYLSQAPESYKLKIIE
ncbi:MAG TPA: carbohydrate kinase family protein [Candidatus Paceibacterota bacterium]